jgi:hypothetical protein
LATYAEGVVTCYAVLHAKNLRNTQTLGKQDPYVTLIYGTQSWKSEAHVGVICLHGTQFILGHCSFANYGALTFAKPKVARSFHWKFYIAQFSGAGSRATINATTNFRLERHSHLEVVVTNKNHVTSDKFIGRSILDINEVYNKRSYAVDALLKDEKGV